MKGTVIEVVLGVLASFGGVAGIIVLALKFSANIIIDRLESRYEQKLSKEMEKYKTTLGNKTYISKTKFDTEFQIYKELSKTFADLVKEISSLIPNGVNYQLADKKAQEEAEEKQFDDAYWAHTKAIDLLNSNTPFIPENIYNGYQSILHLCNIQLNTFIQRWNVLYVATPDEKKAFSKEDYDRTTEIQKQFTNLNIKIRQYLDSLDVL